MQRAAQCASVNFADSKGVGRAPSRSFCDYCLRPLLSKAVCSQHVASSAFCHKAEATAIDSAGASALPQLTRDYSAKTALVDSVLDDMPAYITDEIARVQNELITDERECEPICAENNTDQQDDVTDDNEATDSGETTDKEAAENAVIAPADGVSTISQGRHAGLTNSCRP